MALWGAVKPAYSWGITAPMEGIHVHARTGVGGEKVIDDTFEEVIIATAEGPWRLTAKAATAYLVSSVLGLPLRALGCPRCGQGHLDMFEFATNPHREHQCNSCGRPFWDKTAGVANPCVDLQRLIQPLRSAPMPRSEELVIRQADLSGLAVWGSNQAIICTEPGAETAGIHAHALDLDGQPVADDTFVGRRSTVKNSTPTTYGCSWSSAACPTCGPGWKPWYVPAATGLISTPAPPV